MYKIYIKMSFRNLIRQKSRSSLLAISIVIGTMLLIINISFIDGVIRQTMQAVTGTLLGDIAIFPVKGKKIENYQTIFNLLKHIKKDNNIEYMTVKVLSRGILFANSRNLTMEIQGMYPESELRRKQNLFLVEGTYLNGDESDSIIISKKVAERLQVNVGDSVAVFVTTYDGGSNAIDYRITGIFDSKIGKQFVDFTAYINLESARELVGISQNETTTINLFLKDSNLSYEIVSQIKEELTSKQVKVMPWNDLYFGIIVQQYNLLKYVMLLFNIILFAVIGVGVTNAMFMSITERAREIGTMMALGLKQKQVQYLFLLEGFLLGLLSSLSGLIIGGGICIFFSYKGIPSISRSMMWIFGGERLYPDINFLNWWICVLFVVIAVAFASFLPARRVLKFKPLEAMQHI